MARAEPARCIIATLLTRTIIKRLKRTCIRGSANRALHIAYNCFQAFLPGKNIILLKINTYHYNQIEVCMHRHRFLVLKHLAQPGGDMAPVATGDLEDSSAEAASFINSASANRCCCCSSVHSMAPRTRLAVRGVFMPVASGFSEAGGSDNKGIDGWGGGGGYLCLLSSFWSIFLGRYPAPSNRYPRPSALVLHHANIFFLK